MAAGITDIGIVVGDTAEQIQRAVGDGSDFEARITYLPQDRPAGLAHAVKIARDFLSDDRFVMYLGDNFIQEGISSYVEEFRDSPANARVLLYRVSNPEQFGVAEIEDGRIVGLEEKPRVAVATWRSLASTYSTVTSIRRSPVSPPPSAESWRSPTPSAGYLIAV